MRSWGNLPGKRPAAALFSTVHEHRGKRATTTPQVFGWQLEIGVYQAMYDYDCVTQLGA